MKATQPKIWMFKSILRVHLQQLSRKWWRRTTSNWIVCKLRPRNSSMAATPRTLRRSSLASRSSYPCLPLNDHSRALVDAASLCRLVLSPKSAVQAVPHLKRTSDPLDWVLLEIALKAGKLMQTYFEYNNTKLKIFNTQEQWLFEKPRKELLN